MEPIPLGTVPWNEDHSAVHALCHGVESSLKKKAGGKIWLPKNIKHLQHSSKLRLIWMENGPLFNL